MPSVSQTVGRSVCLSIRLAVIGRNGRKISCLDAIGVSSIVSATHVNVIRDRCANFKAPIER